MCILLAEKIYLIYVYFTIQIFVQQILILGREFSYQRLNVSPSVVWNFSDALTISDTQNNRPKFLPSWFLKLLLSLKAALK